MTSFYKKATIAFLLVLALPLTAQAQSLSARIGPFSPVTVGDTVTLDACASILMNNSICGASDLSGLAISWAITPETGSMETSDAKVVGAFNTGTAFANRPNPANTITADTIFSNSLTGDGAGNIGTRVTISTSNTNFFPTPGNYIITLAVSLYSDARIIFDNVSGSPLVRNETGRARTQIVHGQAIRLTAGTGGSGDTGGPVTVSEPAALFLLFPAIALIARRRKTAKAVLPAA